MIVVLRNQFGVRLVPSITQRFYLDVFIKVPIQLKKNVKILFSLLELANKSISNNDKICIMGDFNHPSIK